MIAALVSPLPPVAVLAEMEVVLVLGQERRFDKYPFHASTQLVLGATSKGFLGPAFCSLPLKLV